jgi:hypothetical protein
MSSNSEVHATVDGRPCTIQPDVNQVTARAPASIRLVCRLLAFSILAGRKRYYYLMIYVVFICSQQLMRVQHATPPRLVVTFVMRCLR